MRKLSIRERVLLLLLAVIAAVSAYILLFYMPVSQQIESLQTQIAQQQQFASQLEAKLETQRQMQQTLNTLATQENALPYMPSYDNLQTVMVTLNTILAGCQEYALSFQGEQLDGNLFCRQVSIPFTCDSYEQARQVLQSLHDSPLRGLLEDVQITRQESGAINATASMRFFEYKAADLT